MKEALTFKIILNTQAKYEKRFGECPIGMMEVGPEKLYELLKAALDNNEPIPADYLGLPEGALT